MGERMVSADEARPVAEQYGAIYRPEKWERRMADLAHTVVELTAHLDAEKARADAAEAKVRAVEKLASNLRKAEAKIRAKKSNTIGAQWHDVEQARLFGEAATHVERALADPEAQS